MFSLKGIVVLLVVTEILVMFLLFFFIPFVLKRADVGKMKLTEEYLIFQNENIPWSQVARVFLKQSKRHNPYLAFYFEDETPPKSVDIAYYPEQNTLINQLKAKAAEKGFAFVEEAVELEDEIHLVAQGIQKMKEEMQKTRKETEKSVEAQNQEKKPEITQRKEREKKEEKKPEIKISPRQKLILKIGLAVAFFLWIYFVFGAEFVIPILIIVFIHEGGHFIALRLLHMKTKGLIFIPFFGAGVIPGDEFASPRTEVAVALAGPVAGLSVNIVGHFFSDPFDLITSFLKFPSGGILSLTILLNLALNLLNLMPILPLDGGRVVRNL